LNIEPYHKRLDPRPLRHLVYFCITLIAGLLIGNIAAVMMLWYLVGDVSILPDILASPETYAGARTALLLTQTIISFIGFVLFPLLFLRQRYQSDLGTMVFPIPNSRVWLITFLLLMASLPLMEYLVQWNNELIFPTWASGFETWAKAKEEELMKLTLYLTDFDHPGQYLIGVLAIAILPAIGEEITFRGILQPQVSGLTGSIHAGIWITALLFSAFHLQFFGFFPRLLIGVLLGYMYVYSRSLLIPILGHFLNNFLGVTFTYLTDIPVNDDRSYLTGPSPYFAALSLTLILLLLHRLYLLDRKLNPSP
jgi:membrane protease YdiL (CAAX protease family)